MKKRSQNLPTGTATLNCGAYLCWTRMQTEAGQSLKDIIARKELERLAGQGLFLWGVGNAPAIVTNTLAKIRSPVPVVFSTMKGRPKRSDVAPKSVLVWRGYIDAFGVEHSLPAHSLVTSRGESNLGTKKRHYALFCWSEKELQVNHGVPFDPSAYRNAGGTGAPVASSQTTALLRQISEPGTKTDYEANIVATLSGSYWVRLTDPLELTAPKIDTIESASEIELDRWTEFVTQIRSGQSKRIPSAVQEQLL